ncbi:glycopeptide antibiotics resistance protein [Terracoccus luteus]|uniref:Glycopeptide antibiotics resistance protein n=1 Tax=Terracoccus luteus TaxID=53356 RepID=A0A495XX50_9MICO|nr:VanZ family protein [Terracoccus luteus]RKT79161.1 glycopeptide antibiotics resistance protein [Terracoccus luteus]
MFHEVPALPVVLPVALTAFVVLLWRLRRRGRLTVPRAAVAAALCVYLGGIIANTVFPVFVGKTDRDVPWSAFLDLAPLADYEVSDALLNVALFVPLGMLVSLVLTRPSWWRVLSVTAVTSLAIETTQYVAANVLGGGHIADVDDLASNVVGGAVGYVLLSTATRIPAVRGLVDRFRWR